MSLVSVRTHVGFGHGVKACPLAMLRSVFAALLVNTSATALEVGVVVVVDTLGNPFAILSPITARGGASTSAATSLERVSGQAHFLYFDHGMRCYE